MNRITFGKPALAALLLAALPALADEGPPPGVVRDTPPVIGFFDTAKPHCFVRLYDAAHMAAHPKQKVTGIAFAYVPSRTFEGEGEPQPMWDQYSEIPSFSAQIIVTLKGEKRTGFGSAYCQAGSDKNQIACGIEGDGGSFTLNSRPDGRFSLVNPQGFAVEFPPGAGDDSEYEPAMIEAKDDHASFLLDIGKGDLCDEQWKDTAR